MRNISYLLIYVYTIGSIAISPRIAAASWCIEAADAPKFFIPYSSRAIVVDGDLNPHIVYGGDYLYYVYYEESGWHHQTVDSAGGVGS